MKSQVISLSVLLLVTLCSHGLPSSALRSSLARRIDRDLLPHHRREKNLRKYLKEVRGHQAEENPIRGTPTGNLVLVSDNFTWAENLAFDHSGHLYVSDWNEGTLYRLTPKDNSTSSSAFPADKETWIGTGLEGPDQDYKLILGTQFQPSSNTMFLVARINDAEKQSAILNVSTVAPNTVDIWTKTECLGNGLSYIPSPTGSKTNPHQLFTMCEADFVPWESKILQMDVPVAPSPGAPPPPPPAVNVYDKELWAADGSYYYEPEGLLYTSLSVTATVRVFNVSTKELVRHYHAPGMGALDDFCVVKNPNTGKATLIGAGFLEGNVIMFDASMEATAGNKPPAKFVKLASGLYSPTSVRPGVGPGWEGPGLFYVSEGGPLLSPGSDHNRRVFQLTVDWDQVDL